MKDLYSFSRDQKEHEVFYQKAVAAYKKIFSRAGIGEKTYLTFASGGSFSKYSHEFQTETEAGEDTIHLCEKCRIAVNDEIIKDQPVCPECGNKKLVKKQSVEVGNIFTLGTRFSEILGLTYLDEKGASHPVFMGSYGIGPGRLMGTIVELLADERGIVWPEGVAPFRTHLVSLAGADARVKREADALYETLMNKGVQVLYDDRDLRAGEKFADSDLIGIPTRIVISEKTVQGGTFEVKDRKTGTVSMLSESQLFDRST